MSQEQQLLKNNVNLNNRTQETSQVLLEGDYIIPDSKPDIYRILQHSQDIGLTKIEPALGRLSFSGRLSISVLYTAKSEDKEVTGLSFSVGIDDFMNIEGVSPESWVWLNPTIAHTEYRIINDRKIGYRAIVDIDANIVSHKPMEVITGIDGLPMSQQKVKNISLNQHIGNKRDEFAIQEDVTIPGSLPPIQEILHTGMTLANKSITAQSQRVHVSGDLRLAVLYRAEGSHLLELFEHEVPFSGAIDMQDAQEGQFAEGGLFITEKALALKEDEHNIGRGLELSVTVLADIRLSSTTELRALKDAYCIDKRLTIENEPFDYFEQVARNKSQFNLKENVKLEGPPALQILSTRASMLIEDRRVVDDKVVVEGVIMADILYIAQSDDEPIFNHSAIVPFRQVMEAKGARAGMEADIGHSLDHVGASLLSGNDAELRFSVNFSALVLQRRNVGLISNIEFSPYAQEELDDMPAMVLVTIGEQDSLWSIAKKYNAPLEELATINELDLEGDVPAGQKILVVKSKA